MTPTQMKTLLETRAGVWDQMCKILERADPDGKLSAEDTGKYDQLKAELADLTGRKERWEEHDRLERANAQPAGPPPPITDPGPTNDAEARAKEYRGAWLQWARYGTAGLEPEQRKVLQTGFVSGKELRAQGVGTTTAGGYLVPAEFRQKLQEALKFFGGMRQVSETIETDSGADLPWPTNDDTSNVGAILAENTQVTEQDLTLGQKTVGAYMYTSKLVRVSLQLIQDSAFDIENWLPRKLGERIGRIHNTHFTTGTGSSQPEGVQTNATVGVTGATGTTLTVTYASLVTLIYSIDAAYRNGGRMRWMMNDATIGTIMSMVDGQSRPLWQPSLQAGQPDMLMGYPITPNNDIPVMAANAKSILFGDFFAGYLIRDVTGVQALRLDERYADFLQVGFLGFQRSSGVPQDTSAVKAYRNSAT